MIPFGVDLVEIGRAERVMRRSGDLMLTRLTTPAEAAWVGSDATRLAVVLAVKEAAIKAVGGRPAGFHWWDVVVVPAEGTPAPGPVSDLLDGFARDAALDGVARLGCWIHGASAAALMRVFDPAAPTFKAELDGADGAAVAGTADGHVWVAAAFWQPVPTTPSPAASRKGLAG